MSKFINVFPVKAENSYFSNFILSLLFDYFEWWKFTENPKTEEFSEKLILARARARGRACIIKFEKYELSGFTGKKNY